MEDDSNSTTESHSSRIWLVIAAVILATLVAVVLVPDDQKTAEDIPQPMTSSEGLSRPPPVAGGKPAEQVTPEASEQKEGDTAEGAMARRFLAQAKEQGIDAGQIRAQADTYREQGLLGDAWLLYFRAAREGDGPAAMALAEQADPAFFDPATSALSKPDLVQARKWYLRAQRSGVEQARQRLEQLLERVKQAARNGDEQAAVLVAQWK